MLKSGNLCSIGQKTKVRTRRKISVGNKSVSSQRSLVYVLLSMFVYLFAWVCFVICVCVCVYLRVGSQVKVAFKNATLIPYIIPYYCYDTLTCSVTIAYVKCSKLDIQLYSVHCIVNAFTSLYLIIYTLCRLQMYCIVYNYF